MVEDIPIENAQIIWSPDEESGLPPVQVIHRPRDQDDPRYDASWGVCNLEFAEAATDEKVRMLLAQAIAIAISEKLKIGAVHEALSVIPEYRSALADVGMHFEGFPREG